MEDYKFKLKFNDTINLDGDLDESLEGITREEIMDAQDNIKEQLKALYLEKKEKEETKVEAKDLIDIIHNNYPPGSTVWEYLVLLSFATLMESMILSVQMQVESEEMFNLGFLSQGGEA